MLTFGILLLLVYIAGSINFAILILKIIGKEDPRTQFSGNAGTTNVYRQAGLGWAAIVLLLDLGRAAAIALLALYLLPAGCVPWIGFSLIVVAVAALNLVLDFDFIERGVQYGAPKYMEWYGAFGIMVTLVWLYLEILRLLSKMRSRN